LRITRPDGQVTKVGWSPDAVVLDMNPLVQRNIRLQGSFSHN
jgi:L-iditol 2-dehydrogenase